MLVILGGRPGKDEHVVPLAGLDLSRCPYVDLFHGDVVHNDLGIVLLAPFLGHLTFEPLVIVGQEMSPFGDLQRLLAGHRAIGKKEERAESGGRGRQFEELSPGGRVWGVPGHFGGGPLWEIIMA